MKRLPVLLAISIAIPAAAQNSTNITPYTFKSSTLGMSLSSFKEKNRNILMIPYSHADRKGKTTVEYRQVSGPICNDEWRNAPVFDFDSTSDQEITCAMTWEGFKSADYIVAGIPMQRILYRFRQQKLFEIEIMFYGGSYPVLAAAFEEKYGKPSDDTPENYQNIFGARWAGQKKEWKNGSESIVIAEGPSGGPGYDTIKDGGGVAIIEDHAYYPAPIHRPLDF